MPRTIGNPRDALKTIKIRKEKSCDCLELKCLKRCKVRAPLKKSYNPSAALSVMLTRRGYGTICARQVSDLSDSSYNSSAALNVMLTRRDYDTFCARQV